MIREAQKLLQHCIAVRQEGADFPTIWQTVLRYHPLVVGSPVQRIIDGNPALEIALITGQRLICDDKGFALH